AAIANGKPVTGLLSVLVFSLGFALVLVVVGLVAARVGQLVLTWLSGRWVLWLQLGTALLILAVGVGLTASAWPVFAGLRWACVRRRRTVRQQPANRPELLPACPLRGEATEPAAQVGVPDVARTVDRDAKRTGIALGKRELDDHAVTQA